MIIKRGKIMNILSYTYDLIQKIKNKEMTFAYCINKAVNVGHLDAPDVVPVKDALKAYINRFYFLNWEVSLLFKASEAQMEKMALAVAFVRYGRNTSLARIKQELMEIINENEENILDEIKVGNALETLKAAPTQLDEEITENFVKRISLTYSYPEWIVGMMRKHFGTKNTLKSIALSRKGSPISVSINKMLVDSELSEENFEKTNTCSTSYNFIGKGKLFEEPLFLHRKVFVMDQTKQKMMEEFGLEQAETILLMGKNSPSVALSAMSSINDLGKIYYATPTKDEHLQAVKSISKFQSKSISIFVSEYSSIITEVPYNSCDRVIVAPPSTNLGLIRKHPEILLQLKREDIDIYLDDQQKYLQEASSFLKDGAELDYYVTTLNKKESFLAVRTFLESHSEFELIKEQLVFPYEYKGEGIYFARLRKAEKKDD
jgi:16S rRNA (cytosine967-C5)-methyltransferase